MGSCCGRLARRMIAAENAEGFCVSLEKRLVAFGDRILLTIVGKPSSSAASFTGPELVEQAKSLVRRHCSAKRREVVLLLLPHSNELFLLHLGLLLEDRIPAILAWPTTRVDAEKYQRNL